MSWTKALLAILIFAGVFLAIWAFWWEPRRLVVRESEIRLDCWRGRSLRIAVLSDLHIGSPFVGETKLAQIVATTNGGQPDLVVLLGDFVIQGVKGGHFVPPEKIAEGLSALRAPLGVYAVLGNHDWWLDPVRVTRALESGGIVVLEDAAVPINSGQHRFWLAGVSDFMEGKHDVRMALSRIDDDAPVIVMTHNPDVFPLIPERACVTLAGHTHGGQVAFPFIGRPIVPSDYGQRYAIGHIQEQGKHLFVTSGVGTSIIPVRFRVAPEVVFLNLGGR